MIEPQIAQIVGIAQMVDTTGGSQLRWSIAGAEDEVCEIMEARVLDSAVGHV